MHSLNVRAEALWRKIPGYILVGLAMLGVVIMPGFAARGRGEIYRHHPQQLKKVNLSVEDGRPVAKAIRILEARYGWVITYEDPRYVYPEDIADVTEQVRRDLHKYPKGAAPRVLVPKGGELSFDYDVLSPINVPPNPGGVVQQLLTAQAASANAGKFRMEQGNHIIHVIPTAIKGPAGKLIPHNSVLDVAITLPAQERTGLQMLEALCKAIGNATQTRVQVGTVPMGLFLHHRDQERVSNQKARHVLAQLFERMNKGRKLSWRLLYGPDTKMYVLNVHMV